MRVAGEARGPYTRPHWSAFATPSLMACTAHSAAAAHSACTLRGGLSRKWFARVSAGRPGRCLLIASRSATAASQCYAKCATSGAAPPLPHAPHVCERASEAPVARVVIVGQLRV